MQSVIKPTKSLLSFSLLTAHGQSQGQRRSSQSVSQWYGHLVSQVLNRDNAQGTTTTRQRANSDHSATGTTRSPTQVIIINVNKS